MTLRAALETSLSTLWLPKDAEKQSSERIARPDERIRVTACCLKISYPD